MSYCMVKQQLLPCKGQSIITVEWIMQSETKFSSSELIASRFSISLLKVLITYFNPTNLKYYTNIMCKGCPDA
ncbi:hypothetical protein QQP08_012010 [Theobroma cacao]|nr:hypothetical protein QQP08_012010 [Theobroma cacao]